MKAQKIMRELSAPLELCERPFLEPARRLGMSESLLVALLRALKKKGVVRRMGAAVRHVRAGFRHNALVAWNIGGKDRERAARYFSSLEAISHCYQRRTAPGWPYSLYTMVHGKSKGACLACIRRMARETNSSDHRVLFTVKEYKKSKINVGRLL